MSEYRIGIHLWDGVEELDFAGPYEVLTSWSRMSEREISVRLVAESTEPVTCSHGLRVLPDVAWADAGALDLLVLPGGRSGPLLEDESFLRRMRELKDGGTLMTSIGVDPDLAPQIAELLERAPVRRRRAAVEQARQYDPVPPV